MSARRAMVACLMSTAVFAALGMAIVAKVDTAAADDGPVLEGATNYNSQRKVAVSPDGQTVAVTYVDDAGGVSSVFVKLSTDAGATWTHLPQVSSATAFRPAIAYDDRSQLHVAWTQLDGDHRQVFYARWDGAGVWRGRVRLSDTPGYSGYPSLALDSDGRVHVVWYGFDGTQYQIYYRYLDRGDDWSTTVQATRWVHDANSPAIAIGPDGVVHVAFFTFVEGVHDVQYMVGGPDGWSPARRANPEGLGAVQPSLVVHDDGVPGVAYSAGEDSEAAIYYSELRSGSWATPVNLSQGQSASESPSLAALPGHGAVVLWETGQGEILEARLRNGTWSAPRVLADGGARWPSASWAQFPRPLGQGPAYAVWTAAAAGGHLLGFRRLDTTVDEIPTGPDRNHLAGRLGAILAGAVVAVLLLLSGMILRSVRLDRTSTS